MQSLAQAGFTADQVKAALHAVRGSRRTAFRYSLLDSSDNFIKDVTNLVRTDGNGQITMASSADQIKRAAQFTVKDDGSIDFLNNRIQGYARLYVPPGRALARYYSFVQPTMSQSDGLLSASPQTGGWVEWPQGRNV